MSFKSFMKDFGKTLLHIGPAVLPFIPGIPPALVPVIQNGIAEAQQLSGASGAEKKRHVLAITNDAIIAHNLQAPKERQIDQTNAISAVSEGIDATVRAINIVHEAQGKAHEEQAKVSTPVQ